ncbi:radical SAM/SPASM domain-containing protein [Streptomyces hoynatensis]|uniref:Radical SAM protein n=1 Tax=Streptomyces hoynatensis TaxID=1141874 RepID=A0A3A9Z6Q5_9ACTN|nr:radical SAM protein [Streptomyces hoynatensis]RKN43948.1 radical SAM protein [Streptomyces hoynatensis]
MSWVRSRYLLLGEREYRDGAGRRVRMAYSTRQARLFALDAETAARLAGGELGGLGEERLRELAARQAVVDEAEDELAAVLGAYREGSDAAGSRAVTVMPTSYCNMACGYCGQEHFKAPVDRARVDRVAARVEALLADPATEEVVVTWFGGEPLLALRVVREMTGRFLAAAAQHGTRYRARLVTNGSLLTDRTLRELHHELRVEALEVTLDGPQEVHDRRRLKRNGRGSFHRTVGVLARAVREGTVPGLRVGIRINVDEENEEHVPDLLADLACFGLASPQVEVHPMPVHSWGNDVSAVEIGARRYAEREAGWLRLARALGLGFPTMPNVVKRTTCVATSTRREILDPAGRVYSCSEHPLVPGAAREGVVATVDQLTGAAPRPRGEFDDWYEQVGDGSQQCGRCPLLPVCGGGCPKLWRAGHMPCPSVRFNWAERMDAAAADLGLVPVGAG